MCKVSIIVPIYNAERFLDRSIGSLLQQTLKDIEVILVDDGSTDKSFSLCKEYAKKDNRIKTIHQQNKGQGLARNIGIENAQGDYIGFIDADDYVDIRMYDHLWKEASRVDSDMALSFSRTEKMVTKSPLPEGIYEGEEVKKILYGIMGGMPTDSLDSPLGMSVWRNIYKRNIIERHNIRFQSERIINSEDILFNMEFLCLCKKVVLIDKAYYYYCDNRTASFSRIFRKERYAMFKSLYKQMLLLGEKYDKLIGQDIRSERRFIANARFAIMECSWQMNHYNRRECLSYIRLIVSDEELQCILEKYPIRRLPMLQYIFFFFLKRRSIKILLILSKLRKYLK